MSNYRHYALINSPLFRLKSTKQLAGLLFIDNLDILRSILKRKPYIVFNRPKPNGEMRLIEAPVGHLKRLQQRIHGLLIRIQPPVYLHSPAKGRSGITNALVHRNNPELRKLDIRKFFPSTHKDMVYRFFDRIYNVQKGLANCLPIFVLGETICPQVAL